MERPLIAIPMGDPAGVGPELVLKTVSDPAVRAAARCLVIGDAGVLRAAMNYPGSPRLRLACCGDPGACDWDAENTLHLIDLYNVDMTTFVPGLVSGACGRAAYEYIERTAILALAGLADAIATPDRKSVV